MAKAWIYKQCNQQGKQLGYYVVYDVGIRPDGRRDRRKKMGFSTKKAAQEWVVRFESELQRGIVPPKVTRLTVRDYLTQWYESKVKPAVSAKTEEGYRSVIGTHLTPAFGQLYLRELSSGHVQEYVNRSIERNLKRNTIRNHLAVLRRALNDAVADDLLSRNVVDMRRISLPRQQSSPYTIWSVDQRNSFLGALEGTQYYPLVFAAMSTGMRRGELLGLRWAKIDFGRRQILIDCARTAVAKDIAVRKPLQRTKTGQHRTIPLTDKLAEVFQQHREMITMLGLSANDADLVYVSYRTGVALSQSEITRVLSRTQKALGLPHIRFHDLRHLFATVALENSIPLADVSSILGHSRTSVTLDVYTHILRHTHKDKMERIADAMRI